ncbi:MAG: hypothetical protein ACFCBU_07925 [Cyanophyceae cyanobacterium]
MGRFLSMGDRPDIFARQEARKQLTQAAAPHDRHTQNTVENWG